MNTKYQHALDEIVRNSCPTRKSCNECGNERICNCDMKTHIDRLQELIDLRERFKVIRCKDGGCSLMMCCKTCDYCEACKYTCNYEPHECGHAVYEEDDE